MTIQNTMKTHDTVQSEAAEWFTLTQSEEMSSSQCRDFERWINSDPINEIAYGKVSAAWLSLETVSESSYIQNIRKEALAAQQTDFSAEAKTDDQGADQGYRKYADLAKVASFLIVIGTGALLYLGNMSAPSSQQFETLTGTQKTIQLADESTIILDTNSRIHVTYSRDKRALILEKGQAHFSVAPDKERPFVVQAGLGEITALGTAFDIRLEGTTTVVKLIEGKVDVTSVSEDRNTSKTLTKTLNAGQQLSIIHGELSKIEAIDFIQSEAWKMGKVIFRDTPLKDAIREMNRYTNKKYILAGNTMGDIPISGIFNISNTDMFTKSLVTYFPLQANESLKYQIVLSRLNDSAEPP